MEQNRYTNPLINESSPYLLQHAHNPVMWHPWSEEALNKAAGENKAMIVSIGYSACHWCHVMEKESFMDEEVAKLMNENFICIKVDREERPDVDHLYMNALQLMKQQGGWPLNMFVLPDGRPFYGGTYFKKEDWLSVLRHVNDLFLNQYPRLDAYANKLLEGIEQLSIVSSKQSTNEFPESKEIADTIMAAMDASEGGLKSRNKFPMPVVLDYLMAYTALSADKKAEGLLLLSLDKMANGGIYDQLGGGFARYTTDPEWRIPHFEKMLYDNAQLISLYAKAYQFSRNEQYKRIVYESIAFLKKELMSDQTAFYAALDADSEGEEGRYYVWTEQEIDEVLGKDAALFKNWFQIGQKALWEDHKNVLQAPDNPTSVCEQYKMTKDEMAQHINRLKNALLKHREKRPKPSLDHKLLCSWNALMLYALLDAYEVFEEEDFLQMARENLDYLWKNFYRKKTLYHSLKNPQTGIQAFLDDYAFLIRALIRFYQISFDNNHLNMANELMQTVIRDFSDLDSPFFSYTKTKETFVAKHIELSDHVIPSANAVMAHNLMYLGKLLAIASYEDRAEKMLAAIMEKSSQQPAYFAHWNQVVLYKEYGFFEVVICGKEAMKIRKEFNSRYLPNVLYAGTKNGQEEIPILKNRYNAEKLLIYVCRNKVCQLPVESFEEALSQMNSTQDV
jgi:uncharacterized protein YyaL (SSP411 family)